jgi:hypothetical protein
MGDLNEVPEEYISLFIENFHELSAVWNSIFLRITQGIPIPPEIITKLEQISASGCILAQIAARIKTSPNFQYLVEALQLFISATQDSLNAVNNDATIPPYNPHLQNFIQQVIGMIFFEIQHLVQEDITRATQLANELAAYAAANPDPFNIIFAESSQAMCTSLQSVNDELTPDVIELLNSLFHNNPMQPV